MIDSTAAPTPPDTAPLLERVLPILHEAGLTLFEEIQGSQTPGSPQAGAAIVLATATVNLWLVLRAQPRIFMSGPRTMGL